MADTRPTVVALYLPQYHPIPENDAWWGKGFTEWTNVAKAKPLYRGHHQPNLPADLGFYDLRLPETRQAQAEMALAHGVDAFCYYHYWFGHGRRVLERPFEEVLASGQPSMPFMLCWANESWTGAWHGLDKRVLVEQTYPGEADDDAHFACLLRAFRDPRYLRVDGKPVFMVYRPGRLPDPVRFCDGWRRRAAAAALPGLYLIAEHADPHWDARGHGFDAFVHKASFMLRRQWSPWTQPVRKLRNRWLDALGRPSVYDYRRMLDYFVPPAASDEAIPLVMPNWDNTPRSGARGVVLEHASPAAFGAQLRRALVRCATRNGSDRLLFVKSWNEWAEGNHLEPNRKDGMAFLQELQRQVGPCRARPDPAATACPTHPAECTREGGIPTL